MHSIARSSLIWVSKVTQLPNDSTDTCNPLRPRRRYCMRFFFVVFSTAAMPVTLRPAGLGDTQRPDAETELGVGPVPEPRRVGCDERARRTLHRHAHEAARDGSADEA